MANDDKRSERRARAPTRSRVFLISVSNKLFKGPCTVRNLDRISIGQGPACSFGVGFFRVPVGLSADGRLVYSKALAMPMSAGLSIRHTIRQNSPSQTPVSARPVVRLTVDRLTRAIFFPPPIWSKFANQRTKVCIPKAI